jgi:hypothetical protein
LSRWINATPSCKFPAIPRLRASDSRHFEHQLHPPLPNIHGVMLEQPQRSGVLLLGFGPRHEVDGLLQPFPLPRHLVFPRPQRLNTFHPSLPAVKTYEFCVLSLFQIQRQ